MAPYSAGSSHMGAGQVRRAELLQLEVQSRAKASFGEQKAASGSILESLSGQKANYQWLWASGGCTMKQHWLVATGSS